MTDPSDDRPASAHIPPERAGGPVYRGDSVRQGDVVLRTRTRRAIFISGLAGIVLLLIVVAFAL